MNEFRADLKDYAFFFSLSVDRRKKKGRGGGGWGGEKKRRKALNGERDGKFLSPSFPLLSIPF